MAMRGCHIDLATIEMVALRQISDIGSCFMNFRTGYHIGNQTRFQVNKHKKIFCENVVFCALKSVFVSEN
jgi:hypothetical protein